jgi:DnaJ homolog subfamily A member 2
LEEGRGPGGASPDDLFSMFFGGGRGRRASAGPRRGEDVNHPIKVSLEDLYNGKTVKLAINRQVLVGEPRMCSTCDGQGIVVELRQIALGMVQQIQRHCHDCEGEGYIAKKKKERQVLEVLVEKGMKHNQKITFRGMADEKPNMEPGNINFIVQEKEHETFKRKGADLLVSKNLSLNEALCGFVWKIKHLDGRDVVIKSKPGEVIKAEADGGRPFVKVVAHEGMPSRGNPFVKGNLYVVFRVEFPSDNDLDATAVASLKTLLPNPAMEVEYDEETAEIVHLDHADVKNFGKGGLQSHDTAYESDDEEGGQQGVQCQQS